MSTKCTIFYREPTDNEPRIHIYDDALEGLGTDEPDVYVQLDGVLNVQLETLGSGRSSLTFRLPRKTAAALGLIPAAGEASERKAP
ncbi:MULTISPECIES: hypothetical protein [Roseateles]|uniref:Uncharacterized protein n=1 Tax=Pelomonas caseinilytica TaxID=2906763 RepID=A0ABS8X9T8_9BURK|nr:MULTISPECIES: hypothetical protein [unclassified Roseateles]MCE4535915.1 hypothetical protein [Pelomonas sp. P7]HEV6968937.1 hypothetical protein [Roseateles sp.]